MQPSDLTLLVVLGTAHDCPTTPEVIAGVAKQLAPDDWQPTRDTVGAAIERALATDLAVLDAAAAVATSAVRTTPLGRIEIVALLWKPIPRSTSGFVRACMSAKLCFLHHLPPPERVAQAERLAELYRGAIGALRHLGQWPRALAGPHLQDFRHQLIQLESELAWLDGIAAWRTQPTAAEASPSGRDAAAPDDRARVVRMPSNEKGPDSQGRKQDRDRQTPAKTMSTYI